MPIETVNEFVDALLHGQLLDEPHRQELRDSLRERFEEPLPLAREMLRRGWLTAFQINQLFLGNTAELVLGQYVLMERLGEGGMGQVFKARHRTLGRVVALKIIRKDCLDNPNALPRFQREIQAVAQLTHPNVVHAFDAGQFNGTYFYSMEHVDGTDLSRMVKQSGPLAVLQACDYIRQAALGLQHALDRGIVHRDVKPANLLVARPEQGERASGSSLHLPRPFACAYRWGVVKILDMGLARLLDRDDVPSAPQLTQLGVLMGTPDFIAPEQARDSRTVDTRSDLYSLGCTFYYLLAGRIPFPEGNVTEKLLHHHLDEPEPLEQVRRARLHRNSSRHETPTPANRTTAEVPPQVLAVVGKLMAKRADDRYQTPGELAEALEVVVRELEAARASGRNERPRLKPTDKTLADAAAAAAGSGSVSSSRLLANGSFRGSTELTGNPERKQSRQTQRITAPRRRWLSPGKRGALMLSGFLLVVMLSGWLAERGQRSNQAALGGQPAAKGAEEPAAGPTVAEREWVALMDPAKHPKRNLDELRRKLLEFRVAHPGSEPAREAAQMMMKMPSPLERHESKDIPKAAQCEWFPRELVAVLGERRPTAQPVRCVAFSPDGRQVARGGDDGVVRRWEAGVLTETNELRGHNQPVTALAYSPACRLMASGDKSGGVRLWDLGSPKAPPVILGEHNGPVSCVAFSPDGKALATGGHDGAVKLWETASGRLMRELPCDPNARVLSLSYSPDGKVLACAREDSQVQLWGTGPQQHKPLAVYKNHKDFVSVVAFSPDGQSLVSASSDGVLRVCRWDGKQLRECKALRGHIGYVNALAFAPDGKALASAGKDHSVRVWDVSAGREMRPALDLKAQINGIAFAPDGRHLATANEVGTVYLIRLAGGPPREPLVARVQSFGEPGA